MQPRCSREAAEMQLRCSRDAAEVQLRCSCPVSCDGGPVSFLSSQARSAIKQKRRGGLAGDGGRRGSGDEGKGGEGVAPQVARRRERGLFGGGDAGC